MKIELADNQLKIYFENEQEQKDYEEWIAEARKLLPRIIKLWSIEPPILSVPQLFEKIRQEDGFLGSFKNFFRSDNIKPIFIRGPRPEGKPGRPIDDRTIVAVFRLICCAPYDLVLDQEKKWRTEKYLADVRDKNAIRAVKKAKYKAQKDADMCVARAQEAVFDFLERYPELVVNYIVFSNVVKEKNGLAQAQSAYFSSSVKPE